VDLVSTDKLFVKYKHVAPTIFRPKMSAPTEVDGFTHQFGIKTRIHPPNWKSAKKRPKLTKSATMTSKTPAPLLLLVPQRRHLFQQHHMIKEIFGAMMLMK